MSTRVYVGGLNHRSREKDIERFFRKFGRIREISLKVNIYYYVVGNLCMYLRGTYIKIIDRHVNY